MGRSWRRFRIRGGGGAAAALVLGAAAALVPAAASELALQVGAYHGYREELASYRTDPLWAGEFVGQRLDVSGEMSLGLALPPSGQPGGALWHVGATPAARWHIGAATDLEFGLGANGFNGTRLGLHEFSTAFQFGEFVGIERRLGASPWSLGLRVSHYSNAAIKRPNRGQEYIGLRLGYGFE